MSREVISIFGRSKTNCRERHWEEMSGRGVWSIDLQQSRREGGSQVMPEEGRRSKRLAHQITPEKRFCVSLEIQTDVEILSDAIFSVQRCTNTQHNSDKNDGTHSSVE
jgi:hypothetical protein